MGVYISSISLKNFKSFKNENIKFNIPSTDNDGFNVLVGENNSGKSSLIEAINFLFQGTSKKITQLKNKASKEDEDFFVEIVFTGELTKLIEEFCQGNKKEVFKKYIYTIDGSEYLKVKRDKDFKKITLCNIKSNEYKNEIGIDAPFKKLFAIEIIEADRNPDEEIKYSPSSIVKKILTLLTGNFEETEEYKEYQKTHDKTFNDKNSTLRKGINKLEEDIQNILKKQFGEIGIKFKFETFEKDTFFKNSSIKVVDQFLDEETDFNEKGEGTQRAISLSLVQIYSEFLKQHAEDTKKIKPFFLFIDEPELSLHPEAQKKLLESLQEISKKDQIFISTHSPYFLSPELFRYVYRFMNSKENGTKVFYDKDSSLKDLQENRKFFFHHRDILFKEKVLFVEGVEDLKRYSIYFKKNNKENLISHIYMLGGKSDFCSEIKTFCKVFKIKCLCIKDLDHLVKTIEKQKNLPKREKAERQKEWFRRIREKIDFQCPLLIPVIKNEFEMNQVLVNPYVDVKDYILEDGSTNPEEFEFSSKLFYFLEENNNKPIIR